MRGEDQNAADMAFEAALACKVLVKHTGSHNYVGDYMYMGDDNQGRHLFKHYMTRAYLAPVEPVKVGQGSLT